ncbi:MAG: magnesium chelatase domain-containing protein, partial [Nocardioidaceae bacterium]
LAMVTAVLQQRSGLRMTTHDVFASTVGGVRIVDQAADLALAFAIASAYKQREVPTDVVAIGEVGLAGELRRVRDIPHRLAEAARLGFRHAIVPLEGGSGTTITENDGLRTIAVPDLESALRLLDLARLDARPVIAADPHRPGRPALGVV